MVVAQLFEVTVSADGSELSSKRVSKLSRRYHLLKKQLRQSAMMAERVGPAPSDTAQDRSRVMASEHVADGTDEQTLSILLR